MPEPQMTNLLNRRAPLGIVGFAFGCLAVVAFAVVEMSGATPQLQASDDLLPVRATEGNTRVDLEWDPPEEKAVIGYRIYRVHGTRPIHGEKVLEIPAFSDIGLSNGRTYKYLVAAILNDGTEWKGYDEAVAIPGARPARESYLLVSSHATNRVLRYHAETAEFIDTFVPAGSGGLDGPMTLVFGSDGHLYVTCGPTMQGLRHNGRVLRYDGETGDFIDVFVSPVSSPIGLAFGPDGNLYVGNFHDASVHRFDGSTGETLGTFVASHAGGLDYVNSLTFGPDGNLYVTGTWDGKVLRYDGETGEFIDIFASGRGHGPNDLSFGPDGNLYVSTGDGNSLLRYDGGTGEFIDVFASDPQLINTGGHAFGPDGNLYVGSLGNERVLRFDGRSGEFNDIVASENIELLEDPVFLTFTPGSIPRVQTSNEP